MVILGKSVNNLEWKEGDFGQIQYQFGYEYANNQGGTSFFYDLDQKFGSYKEEKQKNNFIACMIFDEDKNVAQIAKEYLLQCIKTNIYFQTGFYEEGMQNVLYSLQDYLRTVECINIIGWRSKEYLLSLKSINLFMKIGTEMYVSSGNVVVNQEYEEEIQNTLLFLTQNPEFMNMKCKNFHIQNRYFIRKTEESHFKWLDKEYLIQLSEHCHLINEDISSNIQDIVLSTQKQCLEQINFPYETLKESFPRMQFGQHLLFLKIINLYHSN